MINKRGSVADLFLIVAILFAGSIIFMVGENITSQVVDNIRPEINTTAEVTQVLDKTNDSLDMLDSVFFAIFMGLIISILLMGFLVYNHPAFMGLGLILTIISVIVAVPISNAYQTMIVEFGNEASFTMMTFIMENLPWIVAVIGFTFMIVLYSKLRIQKLKRGGLE